MFLKPKKKKSEVLMILEKSFWEKGFDSFFIKKKKKVAFPFTLVKAIPSNVL